MWVVWPFPAGVSTSHLALRAAAAARRSRGHRVRRVSFRDALGFVRPEPMSTKSARARAPLMRFLQRSPLRRCEPLRPADRLRRSDEEAANLFRRSVLAVLHDFDGFVRRRLCGLVASHYRPWGLSGCRPTADVAADTRPFPRTQTLRSFSLPAKWTPSPRHCWRVHRCSSPSRGWPAPVSRAGRNQNALQKPPPPQGFPRRKSVAQSTRCHVDQTRCSLGLDLDCGLSPVHPVGDGAETVVAHPPVRYAAEAGTSSPWTHRSESKGPTTRSTLVLSTPLL